jgi:hypothetical protein
VRSREQLAWAAGFFEGEGCIGLNHTSGKQRPQLVLSVGQVDPWPMERFVEAVGIGASRYVETRWAPTQQNVYRYRIVSFEKVQAVVAMLWPWLSPRRKQQYRTMLARHLDWVPLTQQPGVVDRRRGQWRREMVDGRWIRTRVA